ncbi:MAG: DUF2934 domain-containing protein [Verrucomicrobia bacterium]|nr:DUF2934 domain-containing protein [Verrucomicrobiota bacterium]
MKTAKVIKTKKTTAPKAKRAIAAAPAPKAKTPAAKPAKTSAPKPVAAAAPAPRITAELIARRAYFIWEQAGRPTGKEREHWLLAEQELKAA